MIREAVHREAVILGGGPAGLATAIALRLRGVDALVVDRGVPPIDKACGEGIMPDGLAALARLGVRLPRGAGFAFRGIDYRDEESAAEADFPGPPGLAVRRPLLHAALVERAAETGVTMLWGLPVRGLDRGGLVTDAGLLAGRWIIGADGLHSRLRRWAGLGGESRRPARFGVRRHVRIPPWCERVEVHWGDGCEAYVTPVGGDEVGVALLWSGAKASFDALLARFPRLAARLAGGEATTRDRGAGPFDQPVPEVQRGRIALVGDAAGYLDPLTGEGLALAFRQAEALAEAIAGGDLARYEHAHRRLARVPTTITRLLLFAERRPELRRRLLVTFEERPALFARLLAIHAGQAPPRRLGLGGALTLARGLLNG